MFQMLYVFISFFKYHEIYIENVLVKCYVYIYIYIVKIIFWSWKDGYDLGKLCLRKLGFKWDHCDTSYLSWEPT